VHAEAFHELINKKQDGNQLRGKLETSRAKNENQRADAWNIDQKHIKSAPFPPKKDTCLADRKML
jgi:hypothetical protein